MVPSVSLELAHVDREYGIDWKQTDSPVELCRWKNYPGTDWECSVHPQKPGGGRYVPVPISDKGCWNIREEEHPPFPCRFCLGLVSSERLFLRHLSVPRPGTVNGWPHQTSH